MEYIEGSKLLGPNDIVFIDFLAYLGDINFKEIL